MESEYADKNKDYETIGGISFTPKEVNVVREMVSGESYKVIAVRLSMSPRTVEFHIRNIMNKVRCNSKSELLAFFNKNGIFPEIKEEKDFQKFIRLCKAKWKMIFVFFFFILALSVSLYIYIGNGNLVITEAPRIQENLLNRGDLITKIKSNLQSQGEIKTAIIVGSGGAGKTTLAREIFRSFNYPIRWEINAETSDSIYNSFFDLATHAATSADAKKELELIRGLQNSDEKRKRLIKLTASLLKESGKWCLLFDNVDMMKHAISYIPNNSEYWGKGTIIITTRNEDIRNVSFIKSSWIINIGSLTEEEQLKLFCDILYGTNFYKLDKDLQLKIKKFLNNIPKMPLDVCAAAYYLKNTKISLDDYEKIMMTSCKDLNDAQGVLLEENVNYSKMRYSIVSSVFADILKENNRYKSLLLFMCLLDSQNIPKSLLRTLTDSVTADKFVYNLRRNSLIVDGNDTFSIHRSSQSIGLDYILSVMTSDEKKRLVEDLTSIITPYEKLETMNYELLKLVPHLDAFLNKLSNIGFRNCGIEKSRINLSLAIGNTHLYKSHLTAESLKYFQNAIELNETYKCLDQAAVALINLKIGEVYALMSINNEAMLYLEKSLSSLHNHLMELAKNYRLIGVMHMRKDRFDEANKYFQKAIAVLNQEQIDNLNLRIVKANIYADMSFNYFMNGINRNNAPKAVEIMQQAIDTLTPAAEQNSEFSQKALGRLILFKSKLAGIYNALGKYDLALTTAQEAENLINGAPSTNSDIFHAQGIIARERGLANLRLNNIKEAYDYFIQAKKIFAKATVGDYLFRLKMHEAESLIRLNRLDEAYKACEEMFATKDHERNNYCDLFYNTCFYHAAVIKYQKNELSAAKDYFKQFFQSMRLLCKNILPAEKYDLLLKSGAFSEDFSNLQQCFQNSLKVFEAIYWKDYEFTKYYVAKYAAPQN